MDPQHYWTLFDKLGEVEVRKRFAAQRFSQDEEHFARQWLDYHAALQSAEERKRTIVAATEAGKTAEDAKAAAASATKAALRASLLATVSMACAMLAIVISVASILLVR